MLFSMIVLLWIVVILQFSASNARFYDLTAVSQTQPNRSLTTTAVEKKVLCFELNEPNERGIGTSTFEFAHYSETILGHTSKFLIPDISNRHTAPLVPKLIKRFGEKNIIFYKAEENGALICKYMTNEAKENGCNFIYTQKNGPKYTFPQANCLDYK